MRARRAGLTLARACVHRPTVARVESASSRASFDLARASLGASPRVPLFARASSLAHPRARDAMSTARRLGNAYVRVLGLGADVADATRASVLVFTDAERYVFNVGEGFQRFCVERRLRLSRLASNVFLTRIDSSACGGLVGMLLTMSDQRASVEDGGGDASRTVTARGPRRRVGALTRAARTLFGNGRAVTLEDGGFDRVDGGAVLVDDGSVVIRGVVLGEDATTSGRGEGEDASDDDDGYDSFDDERASKRVKTSNAQRIYASACYDVKLAGIPGKFDRAAATRLGVPNGPQRGRLVKGESITLDDGRVVTPDMCVGPEQPGPRIIVFDAPTLAHAREARARGDALFGDVSDASVVVHLAGADVVFDEEYADIVRRVFGAAVSATHVFANSKSMDEAPVFASSARIQARLHAVCPRTFPEREERSPPPSPSRGDNAETRDVVPTSIPNAVAGRNMFKYTLIPTKNAGPDASEVPRRVPGFAHRRRVTRETLDLAARARRDASPSASPSMSAGADVDVPECVRRLKRGDVEVVFLGTGSAMPAKYRNVSGFFMKFGGDGYGGNVALDLGEGSLAQMIRRYGVEDVENKLKEMRLVWISHIHADHHVGLTRTLAARADAFRRAGVEPPSIPVVGPRPLRRFLELYAEVEDLCCDFIDLSETTQDKWESETMSPAVARLRSALAGSDAREIIAVPVFHCAHAYGAKLVGHRGWSMVYSGDTRPCPSLVRAAKDATLLIHEATFENGLEDEAKKKRHSTTGEAVQTGIDARCYRTILTHFSQRYPKIPVFDESYTARTTVAFDLMNVDFADLPSLPRLLPAVRSLFDDDDEIAREAAMGDDGDDE